MQYALDILCDWAKANNLKFIESKTKIMIFTRKHIYDKPEIKLNDKVIEYVDTFKYLGVIFDNRLTWKEHLKGQIKKAKASLVIGRRMMGKHWGLSPRVTHWIYTAIVRPTLTYGAVVWVSCLEKETNRALINRVQRMACRMITGSMRSTPTIGMEVLLGLTLIMEVVREYAIASSIRIEKSGHWLATEDEHTFHSHAHIIMTLKQNIIELKFPQDKSHIKALVINQFKTTQLSREYYKKHHIRPMPLNVSTVNCFTDGSKTEEGNTGAGYIIKSFQLRAQEYVYLGTHATVFQAGIAAINMACLTLLDNNMTGKQIDFYIDSQSAFRALESYTLINKSVVECKRLCNKLCEMNYQVTLNWIPAHSRQLGKRHLFLMGMVDSPNCECGEPQEAVHLLTNCSEYRDERMKAFGHFELQPREIREYGLARLLRFAKYTGLWQVD